MRRENGACPWPSGAGSPSVSRGSTRSPLTCLALCLVAGLAGCDRDSSCEGSAADPVVLTPGDEVGSSVCARGRSYYRIDGDLQWVYLGGVTLDAPEGSSCLTWQLYGAPAFQQEVGSGSNLCEVTTTVAVTWEASPLPAPPYLLRVVNEGPVGMSYMIRVE